MKVLLSISLVSSDAQAPYGSLQNADLDAFKSDVQRALAAAPTVQWAVLGADISWNEQIQKGLGCCWQWQLYGTAAVYDRELLWNALRPQFVNCITVPKPVDFADYDGSPLGASYAYKVRFWRRISYWDTRPTRPCWQAAYRELKAKQSVELALVLDRVGLAGRLLTHGLRLSKKTKQLRTRLLE